VSGMSGGVEASVQLALRCLADPGGKARPAVRWQPPPQMMGKGRCFIGVFRYNVDTAVVEADGPAQVLWQEKEVNLKAMNEQEPRQEQIILDCSKAHQLCRRFWLKCIALIVEARVNGWNRVCDP
jgi:hypothetical protein